MQTYNSTSVGVKMQIGSVGVTSSYSENDQYKVNKVGGEQDFGLNLPVFGGGKLNTGYKLCRSIDGTTPSARTYSLGYQHAIGQNLIFR